jgi:hypothetical protein
VKIYIILLDYFLNNVKKSFNKLFNWSCFKAWLILYPTPWGKIGHSQHFL